METKSEIISKIIELTVVLQELTEQLLKMERIEILSKCSDPKHIKSQKTARLTNTIASTPGQLVEKEFEKVKINDQLFINAIKIKSFDQVKQDGNLYYIDSTDHFAFKINGQLFHGNIGQILMEKNPTKIKNCKFEICAKKTNCDYYHNPLRYIGSKDHRNFISNGTFFSSRDTLKIDIECLSSEEIERFRDLTMHNLLCALLMR